MEESSRAAPRKRNAPQAARRRRNHSQAVKTSQAATKSNHVWITRECEVLAELLLRLVETGRWEANNGQFKAGYLSTLQTWIEEKLPETDIVGYPHIDSKIKLWKRQYKAIKLMREHASGLGWNEELKCITGDRKVYEDWCQSHPTAKGLRNNPFPYYDLLADVFGKDAATGASAESPIDSVVELQKEQDASHPEADPEVEIAEEAGDNLDASVADTHNEPATGAANSEYFQGTSKRIRTRRSFSAGHDDEFQSTIQAIGNLVENASNNLGRLADCFQHLATDAEAKKQVTEAKKQVASTIKKLGGFTQRQRVRCGSVITRDADKVNYFFSLTEDEQKEYLDIILDGDE